MPLYEYSCPTCDDRFELLIRGEMKAVCPSCESEDLERLVSLPRIKSETTRGLSMKAAKARDARQATDRMHERNRIEREHDGH